MGGATTAPSNLGGKASPVRLVAPHQQIKRGKTILRLPHLSLGPGFHVLSGPNGSGKSTYLLLLAGLIDGSSSIDDTLPAPGINVRLLLPNVRDLFTEANVDDELAGIDGWARDFVQVDGDRHPLTLSSGEAQRLALAKTLGRPASIYLLDEPEANLDDEGRMLLWGAVERRIADGACIVAASHDPEVVARAQTVVQLEAP